MDRGPSPLPPQPHGIREHGKPPPPPPPPPPRPVSRGPRVQPPPNMDIGSSPLPPQPHGVREHGKPPPPPPPPPPRPGRRGPRVQPPPSGHARRGHCLVRPLPLRPTCGSDPEKVGLIELRRARNLEIMLTKVHMPLHDMIAAVLALDETVLDIDQIDNLIKFCPTKEEMERLKHYTGDKAALGKCEKYFLELMKVPRVESKLRVFSFKIQFGPMTTEFKKRLNTVISACEEVLTSENLKEVMKETMYLGNTLNQETAIDAAAVGFKLDSFLRLSDTHAPNSNMSLMHYLCKDLASKAPVLLDFHKDLESLESASKIRLKSLADEMQEIDKGFNKLEQEFTASERDGPVSEVFCKTLKEFIPIAENELQKLMRPYCLAAKNIDALMVYLGEDPSICLYEQVTATLLSFIRSFKKANEENVKQEELLEKEKAAKEVEMDKDSKS